MRIKQVNPRYCLRTECSRWLVLSTGHDSYGLSRPLLSSPCTCLPQTTALSHPLISIALAPWASQSAWHVASIKECWQTSVCPQINRQIHNSCPFFYLSRRTLTLPAPFWSLSCKQDSRVTERAEKQRQTGNEEKHKVEGTQGVRGGWAGSKFGEVFPLACALGTPGSFSKGDSVPNHLGGVGLRLGAAGIGGVTERQCASRMGAPRAFLRDFSKN